MADQAFEFRMHQRGDVIDYTPGSAVAAGQVVVIGGLTGVTRQPIAANELGALYLEDDVYAVTKITGAITAGAAVYWNATADPVGGTAGVGAATLTVGANQFIGFATLAAASGDAIVYVRLTQYPGGAIQLEGAPSNALADPGASGAIPVTGSGYVPIVTAGAETRTLAAPAFIGEELLIYMKTDGGDCVITCATGINQTGNNTITMNDAGDSIRLNAIESGANLRWRVVYNDGCTLATV